MGEVIQRRFANEGDVELVTSLVGRSDGVRRTQARARVATHTGAPQLRHRFGRRPLLPRDPRAPLTAQDLATSHARLAADSLGALTPSAARDGLLRLCVDVLNRKA